MTDGVPNSLSLITIDNQNVDVLVSLLQLISIHSAYSKSPNFLSRGKEIMTLNIRIILQVALKTKDTAKQYFIRTKLYIVVIPHNFRPNTKVLSLLSETKTECKQSFSLPYFIVSKVWYGSLNPTQASSQGRQRI